MKQLFDFVKTTVIGGVLFLVPLIVLALLLGKAWQFAAQAFKPIEALVPGGGTVAIIAVDLLAVLVLVLIGFLAGLVVRTAYGSRMRDRLEQLVLRKLPGFTLLKSMAHGIIRNEAGSSVQVALANIEDSWVLSFIMEQHPDGLLTVFVPSSPTPVGGSVYYMTEAQVKRLDIPVSEAVTCIMQLGIGSGALLARAQKNAEMRSVAV